uniref:helix-turn-helix domain-containing protein n=1 Tax=Geminisphaera colitermitum TaxID=1148786 RepID=UPI0005BDA18F
MTKWNKTAVSTGVDPVALEAASGRVLFSLAGWRRHEVAAEGRNGVRLQPGGGGPRQVACLQGNVEIDTGEGGAGLVRLEPGAVWSPVEDRGAGGKEIVVRRRRRQTGGGGDSGMAVVMELAFARPLAAEYAEFLARNFGRLVRLPLEGEAWRALRGLESAMVAGNGVGEVVSRRVFGWLAALHDALETRQVHLRDLLRGRIDHLLPECAAHGYSVKALATHLGCSPAWLAGRLQHAWGRPAGEVLHGLRYRQAWELLNTTSMDVAEVGRRCGFG